MTPLIIRLLYEHSPWGPFLSAWLAGFCIVGMDGIVYRTPAGQAYLDEIDI